MKLLKNYLYNVGYQVFVLILPLITVPYVSRVLGSEGIGINAYTNSIISYFVLFGSIGINLYGNRTIAYVKKDKTKLSDTFWEIAFLRIIFISLSYILFLIFLFFISDYKNFYFYQSFLIIAAALDISWFFMGLEDFKKTVMRNTIVKIISLIAIFTLVKTSEDLWIYILILSLSILFGNLTLWPYLKTIVKRPNFGTLNLKKHIKPSLSLFVPQVATQIYLVLNKTMLGYMVGVDSAGYYENTDKLIKVVLAVVTATGTVMLPRMASTFSEGNHKKISKYLTQSFDFVTAICFPMTFGLAAIAPKFSTWFFGKEFAITGQLIPILSLIIIFIGWSNVLGTQYLLPTNQTKYFTISVTTGALINLILNILFIKFGGVLGAIWATTISELCVTFVQIYYVRKSVKIKKLFTGFWIYFIASLFLFGIVRTLNQILTANILSFAVQVIIGFLVYMLVLLIFKAPIVKLGKSFLLKKS